MHIVDVLRKHQRRGAFNCLCGERIAADGAESYPTLPEHQASVVTRELGIKTLWGVVSPDDNDVQDFGPDIVTAEDEVDYLHEEGLDSAHLVWRLQGPWTRATEPAKAT